MSVLDELEGLERRVARRLAELQPLVEEYERLREVADRLGLPERIGGGDGASKERSRQAPAARSSAGSRAGRKGGAGGRASKATQPQSARPASAPRRETGRVRKGKREDQVLAFVKAHPGATVRDVAAGLGVDPTGLYRIVRRLEAAKAITKTGRRLAPA